jgi:hypothetical protein
MLVIAASGFIHNSERIHLGVDRMLIGSLIISGNRGACVYRQREHNREEARDTRNLTH